MIARPYEPKDFETIKAWGKAWGSDYDEAQFPKHGFIVDDLCAYFIYTTDSSICFLENLVRNPEVGKGINERLGTLIDRGKALDLVIKACYNKARELGFTVAYATTNVISAAKRAKEHGAQASPLCVLLTKDLQTPNLNDGEDKHGHK